jgi:hypothetical protein
MLVHSGVVHEVPEKIMEIPGALDDLREFAYGPVQSASNLG